MAAPASWKERIALGMIPAARFGMLLPSLREPIWKKIVKGRLDWRPFDLVGRAHFGASFEVNLADIIQRNIYYFGCWEPQVEAVIAQSLQPGDTFVDVGANIGYFSLLAAHRVGAKGHVFAFEASRKTFQRLSGNIRRNHREGVIHPVHAAVADREDTLTLYAGPEDNCGMSSLLRNEGGTSETVEAKPLGKLLPRESLCGARLVKIDVEGAEEMVLAGLAPDLDDMAADLLLELNPGLASMPQVLEMFEKSGRRPYEIVPTDSLDNYFRAPLPAEVRSLTAAPERRCDVLFTRRTAAELRSIGIRCDSK